MTERTNPLTDEQIERLGQELDALRQRIVDDLGAADRKYIYDIVKWQRALEATGRASLFLGWLPPFGRIELVAENGETLVSVAV